MKLKTTEDYLKTIYCIRLRKGCACAADVAAELDISRPTVSVALKKLVAENYIIIDKQYEIRLTETGRSIAVEIYERHEMFSRLLSELGVNKTVAAKDACQLEHAVSRESYDALKKLALQIEKK